MFTTSALLRFVLNGMNNDVEERTTADLKDIQKQLITDVACQ